MSVSVVDRLEAIEIDENQEARLAVSLAGGENAIQRFRKAPAVEQAGQFIGDREVLELPDSLLLLCQRLFGLARCVQKLGDQRLAVGAQRAPGKLRQTIQAMRRLREVAQP